MVPILSRQAVAAGETAPTYPAGMRYATKAEWAAAKAQQLRNEARLLPHVRAADWRNVKARTRAMRTIHADADRFERMAAVFRKSGV